MGSSLERELTSSTTLDVPSTPRAAQAASAARAGNFFGVSEKCISLCMKLKLKKKIHKKNNKQSLKNSQSVLQDQGQECNLFNGF